MGRWWFLFLSAAGVVAGEGGVAVLLVGSDKRPGYDERVAGLHFSAMRDSVVVPLGADVFVVSDACPSGDGLHTLANLATTYFGDALRKVGVMGGGGSGDGACSVFAAKPTRPPWVQWERLEMAWALLEEAEAARGHYEVVVKLRADATPSPWPSRDAILADARARDDVVHAATDHVFYGSRWAMDVACHTFTAIYNVFTGRGTWASSHFLPLSVAAMRTSLKSLHENSFDKSKWQSYNKAGVLPFPRLLPPKARSVPDMLANLDEATKRGVAYASPANLPFDYGKMANGGDMRNNDFVTEKDFLVWLLYSNVTICDLDGSETYLYKGRSLPRPTRPCEAAAGGGRRALLRRPVA